MTSLEGVRSDMRVESRRLASILIGEIGLLTIVSQGSKKSFLKKRNRLSTHKTPSHSMFVPKLLVYVGLLEIVSRTCLAGGLQTG